MAYRSASKDHMLFQLQRISSDTCSLNQKVRSYLVFLAFQQKPPFTTYYVLRTSSKAYKCVVSLSKTISSSDRSLWQTVFSVPTCPTIWPLTQYSIPFYIVHIKGLRVVIFKFLCVDKRPLLSSHFPVKCSFFFVKNMSWINSQVVNKIRRKEGGRSTSLVRKVRGTGFSCDKF